MRRIEITLDDADADRLKVEAESWAFRVLICFANALRALQ